MHRIGRRPGLLFFLVATLFGVVVFVPFGAHIVDFEPDLSLRMLFHEAFARRLQYGRDLVFTYGPWSILQGGYDPRTASVVQCIGIALALVFGWTATALARARQIGTAAALLATLTVAALFASTGYDVRYFGFVVTLLLWNMTEEEHDDERAWRQRVPLVAATALIALIKFSFFVTAGVVVAAMLLRASRGTTRLVATYVVALAACWLAAGQNASSFPPFVSGAMQIATGYSAAAGSASAGGKHELAAALLTSAGLLAYAWFAERRRAGVVHVEAFACVLFLILKTSFVRYDVAHSQTAMTLLVVIAILYAGITLQQRARRTARIIGVTLVAVQVAMLATNATALVDNAQAAIAFRANAASQHAHYLRELDTLSHAASLPQLHGTVDAYMWGSAALMSREFAYMPRPVFQSYMAWTPALAAMNAAHLRAHPPQWIVMDVHSIDERLEPLDDAPSWLELVSRYDLQTHAGESLILLRRKQPIAFTLAPIADSRTQFGDTIAVPDCDAPLWCTIEMQPSVIGRVRALLLRSLQVRLAYSSDTGRGRGVVVPAMLRSGFLLSPLVRDNAAFAQLLQRTAVPPAARIRALQLQADDAGAFSKDVRVRFYRVAFVPDRS